MIYEIQIHIIVKFGKTLIYTYLKVKIDIQLKRNFQH